MAEREDIDKFKNNKNQINYVANTLSRIESDLFVVSKNTDTIVSKIPDDLKKDWIRIMGKTMPYIMVLFMIVDNIMWFRGIGQINTFFRCFYMIVPMIVLLWTMKSSFNKNKDKMVFFTFVTSSLTIMAIRILWDLTHVNHLVLLPVSLFPLFVVIVLRVLINIGEKDGQ